MFILVDDKNRENEGDLVVPGSNATLKHKLQKWSWFNLLVLQKQPIS